MISRWKPFMSLHLQHKANTRFHPVWQGDLFIRFFSKVYRFKDRYPELYKHVHPESKPLFDQPWIGSSQKVKWVCEKGPDHIWESEVGKRIRAYNHSKKFVCIYCIGRKVSVTNALATTFPDIAKEWCYEKNGDLTPNDITYGSSKLVWWQCPIHPEHTYQSSPNDRTYSKRMCPYCNQTLLCETNSLQYLYPDLSRQWDTERNGELTPDKVLPTHSGKVWWKCDVNPSHHWECAVNYRVRYHWGCPYCSHHRFDELSLASMYPLMAKDWDYSKNGEMETPDILSANSEKIVWWKCAHGVEWKQSIKSRKQSYLNGYHRCPICRMNLHKELDIKWHVY